MDKRSYLFLIVSAALSLGEIESRIATGLESNPTNHFIACSSVPATSLVTVFPFQPIFIGVTKTTLKILIKEIVRCVLKEQSSDKFYWLSPSGEFHNVSRFGHDDWAAKYLKQIDKYPYDDGDLFSAMSKLGWYRVVYFQHFGVPTIEYEFAKSNPPTPRQIKAIKDLAIELGAKDIIPRSF